MLSAQETVKEINNQPAKNMNANMIIGKQPEYDAVEKDHSVASTSSMNKSENKKVHSTTSKFSSNTKSIKKSIKKIKKESSKLCKKMIKHNSTNLLIKTDAEQHDDESTMSLNKGREVLLGMPYCDVDVLRSRIGNMSTFDIADIITDIDTNDKCSAACDETNLKVRIKADSNFEWY